jgi:hypothetical protein
LINTSTPVPFIKLIIPYVEPQIQI